MKIHKYLTKENIEYSLTGLKQLTFEVTDACNLRCKYCGYGEFYDDYDKREDKMFNVQAAFHLIDYLASYWNSARNTAVNKNVYISFYGGEPLINMEFIKAIVNYIENLDCPYRTFTFSMTTNALLLKKYMDYLVEHQFSLLISLDGNEYNTSYRVDKAAQPAFQRITENIDALREKYPTYFEEKVNFNAVLHNRNSVDEIFSFIKEKYDKIPSIGELNSTGIRPDKVALFTETYHNSTESLHQSKNYATIEKEMFLKTPDYRSLATFIHQYSGFVYKDYTDLLYEKLLAKKIPTGTCLPFGKKMFVTVNGKILPCEKISHKYVLGEVTEKKVSLDLQAIADKYNAYYAKMNKQCNRCYRAKSCIQCIFNLDDLEEQTVCYGYSNKQKFKSYFESNMDFLRKHTEDYYRIMEEVFVEQ